MVIAARVSLEEFLEMDEDKPYIELINGEVVEKPMPGKKYSDLVFELARLLGNYLTESGVGIGETELRHLDRDEERVYLPDISVTRMERLRDDDDGEISTVHPDFVIEVLSPDDRAGRVLERVDFYLRSGVGLVWVVNPQERSVVAYSQDGRPRRYTAPAGINAGNVLPGFELDLAALFAVLERRPHLT